jgi:hypothetical protein
MIISPFMQYPLLSLATQSKFYSLMQVYFKWIFEMCKSCAVRAWNSHWWNQDEYRCIPISVWKCLRSRIQTTNGIAICHEDMKYVLTQLWLQCFYMDLPHKITL